jgi:hypothetical protein
MVGKPGKGLMITQMLIGSIAGGLVTVKIYWRKLKAKFRPPVGTNSEPASKRNQG